MANSVRHKKCGVGIITADHDIDREPQASSLVIICMPAARGGVNRASRYGGNISGVRIAIGDGELCLSGWARGEAHRRVARNENCLAQRWVAGVSAFKLARVKKSSETSARRARSIGNNRRSYLARAAVCATGGPYFAR